MSEPIHRTLDKWDLAAWQQRNGKWIVTATETLFTNTKTGEGRDLEQALFDLVRKTDLDIHALKKSFGLED